MQCVKTIYLDQIDSTQAYAKLHAAEFDPERLTCIIAEEQTGGRGRFQRKWHSPRGVNLYVTFYFVLPLHAPHVGSLAQVMAYTLATLLSELNPKVKWPNDVQINGKKVAGILCETVFGKERIECFLGIGVNVNMGPEELESIDQPATSLKQETGKTWDRSVLLQQLLEQWRKHLTVFREKGFTPFHDALEDLLAYKGEEIDTPEGRGLCHSLEEDGRLKVYFPETKTFKVISCGS